jgi:hypothetical protein
MERTFSSGYEIEIGFSLIHEGQMEIHAHTYLKKD